MGWGVDTIDWPDTTVCDTTTSGSDSTCCATNKCCKKTVKFWYVRNSWTEGWGDNGYFKMAWYVSPDDRQTGSVGNSYSQFDQQLLVNTPPVHLTHPSQLLPAYSGMYLLSGFDEKEDPIPIESVNVRKQVEYKGEKIHPDEWYKDVSLENPFPVTAPIEKDPAICLPHATSSISGRGSNGGNSGNPIRKLGNITSPRFFENLYANKPMFATVIIAFVLLLVLVFAVVRSAK